MQSALEAGIQATSPYAKAMTLSTQSDCLWDDQYSRGLFSLSLKALPLANFHGDRRGREEDGEELHLSHRQHSRICLCVHRIYPEGYTGNQVAGW